MQLGLHGDMASPKEKISQLQEFRGKANVILSPLNGILSTRNGKYMLIWRKI